MYRFAFAEIALFPKPASPGKMQVSTKTTGGAVMKKVFGAAKLVVLLAALAALAFAIVCVIGIFTALDSATKAYGYADGSIVLEQSADGSAS